MALVAICLGYFMVILDATVVNVALPALADDLGGGLSGLQWVLDGYTLVFAGLLLSAGSLGDRLGGRRVFDSGLVLFTLASGACAAAPSVPLLVAARVAQGLGAALLVPSSLALQRGAGPWRRAARAQLAGARAAGAAARRLRGQRRPRPRGGDVGGGGGHRRGVGPGGGRSARVGGELARGVPGHPPGGRRGVCAGQTPPAENRRVRGRRH